MVPFNWQPSAAQLGEHVVCFLARDHLSTPSPPLCLVVVVEDGVTEVRLIVLLGLAERRVSNI